MLAPGKKIAKYLFLDTLREYRGKTNTENEMIEDVDDDDTISKAMNYLTYIKLVEEECGYYTCPIQLHRAILQTQCGFAYPIKNIGNAVECSWSSTCVDEMSASTPLPSSDKPCNVMTCFVATCSSMLDKFLDYMPMTGSPLLKLAACKRCSCSGFPSTSVQYLLSHVNWMKDFLNIRISKEEDKLGSSVNMSPMFCLLKIYLIFHQKRFQETINLCKDILQEQNSMIHYPNGPVILFQIKYVLGIASSDIHLLEELLSSVTESYPSMYLKWKIRLHLHIATLRFQSHYDEYALQTYENCLNLMKEIDTHGNIETESLEEMLFIQVAKIYAMCERFENAFSALDAVNCSKDSPNYIELLHCKGFVHSRKGNYTSALETLENALEILYSQYGSESMHSTLSCILYDIGVVNTALRRYAEALPIFEQCLHIHRTSSCNDYCMEVGSVLTCIANVYLAQGIHQQALDR